MYIFIFIYYKKYYIIYYIIILYIIIILLYYYIFIIIIIFTTNDIAYCIVGVSENVSFDKENKIQNVRTMAMHSLSHHYTYIQHYTGSVALHIHINTYMLYVCISIN
jgi:hypothetical protein